MLHFGALDQLVQQQWVLENSLHGLDENRGYVETIGLRLYLVQALLDEQSNRGGGCRSKRKQA